MKTNKLITLFFILAVTVATSGCWTSPSTNTVQIQTIYGKITQVVRPPGIWTITTWGDEYHEISLQSQTPGDYVVSSSTNDNAGFKWAVGLSFHLPDNNEIIVEHVKKFGVSEESREQLLTKQIGNRLQAEINNSASNFDAYKLLASQEAVQKQVFDNMKKFFTEALFLELDDLQLKGKPDFDNDAIDLAGSNVVANQKAKEAEQAGLEADKIKQDRQKIQAENLSNPALFKVRMLELQIELERARAEGIKGHNGNLTVVYGSTSGTNLQLNNQ